MDINYRTFMKEHSYVKDWNQRYADKFGPGVEPWDGNPETVPRGLLIMMIVEDYRRRELIIKYDCSTKEDGCRNGYKKCTEDETKQAVDYCRYIGERFLTDNIVKRPRFDVYKDYGIFHRLADKPYFELFGEPTESSGPIEQIPPQYRHLFVSEIELEWVESEAGWRLRSQATQGVIYDSCVVSYRRTRRLNPRQLLRFEKDPYLIGTRKLWDQYGDGKFYRTEELWDWDWPDNAEQDRKKLDFYLQTNYKIYMDDLWQQTRIGDRFFELFNYKSYAASIFTKQKYLKILKDIQPWQKVLNPHLNPDGTLHKEVLPDWVWAYLDENNHRIKTLMHNIWGPPGHLPRPIAYDPAANMSSSVMSIGNIVTSTDDFE